MPSRPSSRKLEAGSTDKSSDGAAVTSGKTDLSSSDYVVATTRPDELLRHDISDEELEMFTEWRMDHVTELWYMALGGVFASTIPASLSIRSAYFVESANGLDFGNFLEVGGFLIASTALGICHMIRRKRGDNLQKKANEIRDRTKSKQRLIASSVKQGAT